MQVFFRLMSREWNYDLTGWPFVSVPPVFSGAGTNSLNVPGTRSHWLTETATQRSWGAQQAKQSLPSFDDVVCNLQRSKTKPHFSYSPMRRWATGHKALGIGERIEVMARYTDTTHFFGPPLGKATALGVSFLRYVTIMVKASLSPVGGVGCTNLH